MAPLTELDELGHDGVIIEAYINYTDFYINSKIVLFNVEKAI